MTSRRSMAADQSPLNKRSRFESPLRPPIEFDLLSRSPDPLANFSPRLDLRADDVESIGTFAQIQKAQREASEWRLKFENAQIEFEKQKTALERNLTEESSNLLKSKKDLRFILEEEAPLKQRLGELERANSKLQEESERQLSVYQQRLNEKQDELFELRDKLRTLESASHLQTTEATLLAHNTNVEQFQQALGIQLQVTADLRTDVRNLQRKLDESAQELLETRLKLRSAESAETLRKDFHEQLDRARDLESRLRVVLEENQQLRELSTQAQILKEEKHSLEMRLQSMESLRDQLVDAHLQLTLLKKEKMEWASFLSKSDKSDFDSPHALAKTLAIQRQQYSMILDEHGALAAQLKAKDLQVANLTRSVQEFDHQRLAAEEKAAADSKAIKRLERLLELSNRETQFLREQLRTFDMDEANKEVGEKNLTRIRELEAALDSFKAELRLLETESREKDETIVKLNVAIGELRNPSQTASLGAQDVADQDKLKTECVVLRAQCEALEKQVAFLESEIGRGVYNPEKTKVIHMSVNPESTAAAAEIASLREENERLRNQVGTGDPVAVSSAASRLENEELAKKLADTELRLQRLKEVFSQKILVFRESCYSLTGYKIDMIEDSLLRLTSMYAEREVDELLFQRQPSGGMQLLENEYSKALGNLINVFLMQRKSIPAFLSQLTLELFERQTIV